MPISRPRTLAIVLLACAGATWAVPAAAENPFISFLRGDWLRPRGMAPQQSYMPPVDAGRLPITVTPRQSGGGVVYCVRTCDGRYFPLAGVSSGDSDTASTRCGDFCPASPVKVFVSHDRTAGIDAAYSYDGDAYRALPNAYAYRTELKPACSCNGGDGMGLGRIDIKDDPTLKPGDMVATGSGIVVFRGDRALPHADADFVAARNDGKLPASLRRQVEAIEMASDMSPASSVPAPSGL